MAADALFRAPLRPALSMDFTGAPIHTVVFLYLNYRAPMTCSHPPPFVHLEDNLSDDSCPWLKLLNYQKPSGATWEMQQWQIYLEAIHFFPPAY